MAEKYSKAERRFLGLVALVAAVGIFGFDVPAKTAEVWGNGELGLGDIAYPLLTFACFWSGSAAAASAILNRPAIQLERLQPGNVFPPIKN